MEHSTEVLIKIWNGVKVSDDARLAKQSPTPGIAEIDDIPYIDDGNKYHLLDVYYPQGRENDNLPVIVDIHGGGWFYGDKELNKYYCLVLASCGFCVFNISYRLIPDVTVREELTDCFDALKFISENYSKYPADWDRLYLTGDSAGGQFAALIPAIMNNPDFGKEFNVVPGQFPFKACGLTSPVCDVNSKNPILQYCVPSMVGPDDVKALTNYKFLNFSDVFNGKVPPMFITTARLDPVVFQGLKIKKILSKAGVECKIHVWKSCDGQVLSHVFMVTDPYSLPGRQAIKEMTDFFLAH
jgi:acetyl esterase